MAAVINSCPPVSAAAPLASEAEFSCNACNEHFGSSAEQRAHCKSERHVYNTKRRLAGLKPISQEAWDRKVRESRNVQASGAGKGTAHLKPGKEETKAQRKDSDSAVTMRSEVVEEPYTPAHCLFDRKTFKTTEECIKYMGKTYSFMIPDREYCTDVEGLLTFLHEKITEPPFSCLFCNRPFPDALSVRRHMLDKSHTRIGTEARTRRGNVDEFGSEELQADLEDFYDFHASTREITERITDPRKRVAALLRFFDEDGDGKLNKKELGALWSAAKEAETSKSAEGGADVTKKDHGAEDASKNKEKIAVLSDGQYAGACALCEVPPEDGLDTDDLFSLYENGLANLEAHYDMLQDRLATRLGSHKKATSSRGPRARSAVDKAEDGKADETGAVTKGIEEDEGSDDESDSDSSDTEIIECEDEAEFEEVMRILGLQSMTILENGDLRLPSGGSAVHRDVAYVWKQRGERLTMQLKALGDQPTGRLCGQRALRGGQAQRCGIMLSGTSAGLKQALTRKEMNKEGKKIMCVLREQQKQHMRLGLQTSLLLKKKPKKFKTVLGDMSGSR